MNLYSPVISGSLTVTGSTSFIGNVTMTGTVSATASNAALLDGTGSVGFTTTGSFTTMSGSVSSRVSQIETVYATTGSNSFRATQSITGSLTVTGQIIAQTLNVQQVTSSIVYSSGSNVFGCDINSRQTFTGSFYQTGSVAYFSDKLGVGVENPQSAFQTNGNISFSETGFPTARLQSISHGHSDGCAANNYLGFNISDGSAGGGVTCEKMRINGSGNVGIGTTTPATALHVSSSATQITLQNSAGGGNARRIGMYMTSGDTFKILSLCDNNNTRVDNILVANVLNGNVGILCSSPGFTLDVNGSLNVCTSTGAQISLINYGGSSAKIRGSKGTLGIEGCGAITLETNGANERVRVNVNGETAFSCQICALSGLRFGIGATTLNYFEEGCWQPVLRDSNNSTIANDNYTNSGRYTRIGNRVFFSLYSRFNLSGVGSGDGGFTTNLRISLPFTACSTAPSGIGENFAPINISYWSSFYCLNSGDFPSGYIRNGENNVQLTFQNTGCLSEFTFGTSRLTRSASGGIMMAGNYYAS